MHVSAVISLFLTIYGIKLSQNGQNTISNELIFKEFLGEHNSGLLWQLYWILKLHDSTRDLSAPPVLSTAGALALLLANSCHN